MNSFLKKNLLKIAVILTMLTCAATCLAAGTFAALSAEYVWTSDTAETGVFDFENTSYTLDLFDGEYVFPGDSGSGTISAPDFGENTVSWSFSETNDNTVPVIYYTLDTDLNPVNAYSKYDFATAFGEDYYVKLSGKYLVSTSVSSSSDALCVALDGADTLYWAWPENVYSYDSNAETYSAVAATDAKVTAYDEYNAELCAATYAFDDTIVTFLNAKCSTFIAYVESVSGDLVLTNENCITLSTPTFASDSFTQTDGKLYVNGTILPIADGTTFATPESTDVITKNQACVFMMRSSKAQTFITDAETAGVRAEILCNCTLDAGNTSLATPDESGIRTLIKVFPSVVSSDNRASVGVTVTATVTQA